VSDLAPLATERYISLTTFKRDGTAVSTPVWVVSDDGRRLLVWSAASAWKVKRIRRHPRVRVAACDMKGKVRGEAVEGEARFLGPDAEALVQGLLRKKYRVTKRGLDVVNALMRRLTRKPAAAAEYIEILPLA
jgi:uncharacterized protein